MERLQILIVEDDPDVGALVAANLGSDQVAVTVESNGTRGLGLARGRPWNLVILDWNLPGTDGLAICRDLCLSQKTTPVILLTSRTLEPDRVAGLDSGAVDFITKPFGIEELKARVRVQLRRNSRIDPTACSRLAIGEIEIDPDSRIVRRCGQKIALTGREFGLLHHLMRHAPRAFTREQLLNSVWGPAYDGYAHTVNSHINRLRSKLEADPERPQFIMTVWGHGYRFGSSDTA